VLNYRGSKSLSEFFRKKEFIQGMKTGWQKKAGKEVLKVEFAITE
jgi:hypothetical protein